MKYTAAVVTISDKGARGERVDTSGPTLVSMLEGAGWDVVHTSILPDEAEQIKEELIRCSDELGLQLVLTTGGTGFSPRDITPEATRAVVERETPGIPEAMRAESMRITPRGCLSRSAAGIRGRTLIINLPGSEKAARENLAVVLDSVRHGVDMMCSAGSADCAQPVGPKKKTPPSMDTWLKEAKADESASKVGMYLVHNGTVRETAKAQVRFGEANAKPVKGMRISYDQEKMSAAIAQTKAMDGIYYIRAWLNEGQLDVGDDIMYVLIGGDIRPRVVDALQFLVGKLKQECVTEQELN